YPHPDPPELLVFERAPYTLSKLQCQIEIEARQVVLRDMGSRLGTKLNDKRFFCRKRESQSVVVPKGSHTLILGLHDGPFRFRLEVL
ncbi:MAG: FHA domain-containing protein, partial [Opitutales bacterium]